MGGARTQRAPVTQGGRGPATWAVPPHPVLGKGVVWVPPVFDAVQQTIRSSVPGGGILVLDIQQHQQPVMPASSRSTASPPPRAGAASPASSRFCSPPRQVSPDRLSAASSRGSSPERGGRAASAGGGFVAAPLPSAERRASSSAGGGARRQPRRSPGDPFDLPSVIPEEHSSYHGHPATGAQRADGFAQNVGGLQHEQQPGGFGGTTAGGGHLTAEYQSRPGVYTAPLPSRGHHGRRVHADAPGGQGLRTARSQGPGSGVGAWQSAGPLRLAVPQQKKVSGFPQPPSPQKSEPQHQQMTQSPISAPFNDRPSGMAGALVGHRGAARPSSVVVSPFAASAAFNVVETHHHPQPSPPQASLPLRPSTSHQTTGAFTHHPSPSAASDAIQHMRAVHAQVGAACNQS